ncbi:uncharacterized protein LOC111020778 [Momordica charantia]|uniref:Uncharacterized protein LOC111020778 n=1 Tax=Momordica charantia TaxID=3673 RepID=A0A6J1DGZ2_MOMCH|nr:uncharacterized protein LOC111020778 [Momordica charantia]
MGNSISPSCLRWRIITCSRRSSSSVKLVFYEGTTRILTGKHVAGEIMFQFPDRIVCHADSFFIGHPLPALAMDDHLLAGHTYFVLPIDRFPSDVPSTSSLAALGGGAAKFSGECPFEYLRGANGRLLIKVVPEFIMSLVSPAAAAGSPGDGDGDGGGGGSFLCSTPELQKHYDQLVGSKGQMWSPKLETISEYKIRYSPCKFVGFKLKQKEG